MAMGKREREGQKNFWIPSAQLPTTAAHPFYEQINRILDAKGFDGFVEGLCGKFYAAKMGHIIPACGRTSRSRIAGGGAGRARRPSGTRCMRSAGGFAGRVGGG